MTDLKLFRRGVRFLRRRVPIRRFRVRVVLGKPDKGNAGNMDRREDRRIICIDRSLSQHETFCVLIHEWAHALEDVLPFEPSDVDTELHAVIERRISNLWDAEFDKPWKTEARNAEH